MMTSLFNQGRQLYQYHRSRHERRFRRELTAGHALKLEEVAAVLDQLGIGSGDRVSIHSHSAVLAQVQGGLTALLEHLKERVTPRGLLWMTTSPFRGDSYAYSGPYNDSYAARNGFVCQPGTWFKGEDGRRHICQ